MKNVFTLTKTITLAALLLVFVGASAAIKTGDDTTKCKRNCCKRNAKSKADIEATAIANVMNNVTVQVKVLDATSLVSELEQSFAIAPVKTIRTANNIVVVKFNEPVKTAEATNQKIDFNNLDKEMEKAQENMSQMDTTLKNDEAKSRKNAEEILKTGIKS